MTHDELLARINSEIDNCLGLYIGAVLGESLKAVVELHKPFNVKDEVLCEGCCQHVYLTDYPCPTIQAIKEQLK